MTQKMSVVGAGTPTNQCSANATHSDARIPVRTSDVDGRSDADSRRWTDEDMAYAVQEAWELGYTTALRLAAMRVDEITFLWQPIERPTREQALAARLAGMRPTRPGPWDLREQRGDHPGGPVDWETGRPLQRVGVAA